VPLAATAVCCLLPGTELRGVEVGWDERWVTKTKIFDKDKDKSSRTRTKDKGAMAMAMTM